MVYLFTGILLSKKKKEGIYATCLSYAEGKEVRQKEVCIVWFHLYKILKNSNLSKVKERKSVVACDKEKFW